MEVTNRKVFELNLKLLRYSRVYGVKDTKFGWFLAVTLLINNMLQNADIIHNHKTLSLDGLVIRFFLIACLFNVVLKFVVFLFKHKGVDVVMAFINDVWDTVESSKDTVEMNILHKSLNRGSNISLINLGSMLIGITLAASYPLIIGARELPYEWYIPGVDTHASPLYDFLYAYQSLFLLPGMSAVYVAYLNLMVTWLIFGLVAFQLLAEKIRRVTLYETEQEKMKALHECIRFHNRIIDFIHALQGIISMVSFVEVNLLSLMLCFLMFYVMYINENIIMLITVISYVNCVLYMVFMAFLHANDLTYESVTMADAIYNLNWYEQSKAFKSCLILFMVRSQKPIELKAGIYPLTLPTFMQLIKASYTYLTVLKQANN